MRRFDALLNVGLILIFLVLFNYFTRSLGTTVAPREAAAILSTSTAFMVASATSGFTLTPTRTLFPTTTPSPTKTLFPSPTNSTSYPTNTPVLPTSTPYATSTSYPTNTPVVPTSTPYPTNTPVPPTPTFLPTDTPYFTSTPYPMDTPVPPTSTPYPTNTPVPPTPTPYPTDTPVPPTPTFLPTDTPYFTSTPYPTNTPVVPTPTPYPTNTPYSTSTFLPTDTPYPVITVTLTPSSLGAAPDRNYFTIHRPVLTWGRVEWARGYYLQIASDSTFLTQVYVTRSLTADQLEVNDLWLPNGDYYWRVCALTIMGLCGRFSEIESFTIAAPND